NVYQVRTRSQASDMLARRTTIEVTKDGTLSIEFEDHNPRFAAAVISAYVESLRDLMYDLSSSEAAQRRDYFYRQLATAKIDLEKAESQLRDTQARTGVLQL